MEHGLYEVKSFKVLRPYTLEIRFDDGLTSVVNFDGVLEGELYGPLKDPALFESVKLDEEAGNLVWPNGADFDPEILHDWPKRKAAIIAAAQMWKTSRPQEVAPSAILASVLHIGWSIVIGFVAGLIANFVMRTYMGLLATAALGILGSVVGGLIARFTSQRISGGFGDRSSLQFSVLGGALGAIVVLLIISTLRP